MNNELEKKVEELERRVDVLSEHLRKIVVINDMLIDKLKKCSDTVGTLSELGIKHGKLLEVITERLTGLDA